MIKKVLIFIIIISCSNGLFAQKATLRYKVHNVGKVRQLINNMGTLSNNGNINFPGLIFCEYPPNSSEEHLVSGGIWIGGIIDGDSVPVVSVTEGEGSANEFYPSQEPWDSIWVINRSDTVDIPYWKKYVGISDQDFVCRYSDDGPISMKIGNHTPMNLDIIQTSHAWSNKPLDEIIVLNYYIIPKKKSLHKLFLTVWINGNEGYAGGSTDYALDDESFFREDLMTQFCRDVPGGIDGEAIGPIGEKIFPPEEHRSGPFITTYMWYNGRQQGLPSLDAERYEQMTQGSIMEDQVSTGDGTKSQVSFGPYELQVGDTLRLTYGIVLGVGIEGVVKNIKYLEKLKKQNYRVPAPPPPPPFRVETANHQVTLDWKSKPGDINPEEYKDPYRADTSSRPFEGYRVYKSVSSISGPWTLLSEYDIKDNPYGQNTGIFYNYINNGLLNNFEYYYTVTAFSKPDSVLGYPSQESSLNVNAKMVVPGPIPPKSVGNVAVVPNPYRGDLAYHTYNPPWERPPASRDRWMEQDRRIQFIYLPEQCEIRIYTISGDLVNTIYHNNPNKGYEDWNLTSSVGQAVSSGIYLYSVKNLKNNEVQVDKFVIIK